MENDNSNSKRVTIVKQGETYFASPIEVKVGDTIVWHSEETDFRLFFPKGRDPLSIGASDTIKAGREFRREVSTCAAKPSENNEFDDEDDSKKERYQYSIFCYENNTMAQGNSSPEMIIKR